MINSLWDTIMHIMVFPEGEKKGARWIYEVIMAKNFTSLEKEMTLHIQD